MTVDGTEDGGVRGLRAWVADAERRAKRLFPVLRGGPVPLGECEDSISELEQLVPLLDHDPEALAVASAWLGVALAMRQQAGGGTAADRDRAESLLREVRDADTTLGSLTPAEHRKWAALALAGLVSPLQDQPGARDVPDLSALLDFIQRVGPAGMFSAGREMQALLAEAADLPLPAEALAELRKLRQVSEAPTPQGVAELFDGLLPHGDPFADELRRLFTTPGSPGTPGPAAPPPSSPSSPSSPGPTGTAGPAGLPSFEDLRRIATGLDAVNAATHGLDSALDGTDPHRALNDLLARLQAVQEQPPPGFDPTRHLEALRALLLGLSPAAGGSRQDHEAARRHLSAVEEGLAAIRGKLPPGVGDPMVLARVMRIYDRIVALEPTVATPAAIETARTLVAEAEQLAAEIGEGFFRGLGLLTLGAARAKLGLLTRDRALLLAGVTGFEEGTAALRAAGPPFGTQIPVPALPHLGLLREALAEQPSTAGSNREPAPDPEPAPPHAPAEEAYQAALALGLRYGQTRDRALLDRMIVELERLRAAVRAGQAPRIATEVLWYLAEAYRARSVADDDVRDLTALEAAKEALTALAADVLLQAGAEHGLTAARTGASRGVTAALWAVSQGRLHEAVAALESGRALVLHAASTSAAVPELLDRDGHHTLATAWRTATAGTPTDDAPTDHAPTDSSATESTDAESTDAESVPAELPSTLRRQALEALGYRRADGLLTAPTLAELSDALADSDTDALLYLIPGDAVAPGVVLAVAPALGAGAAAQEQLGEAQSAPLERYLDAAAAYDAAGTAPGGGAVPGAADPALRRAWEEALTALCDWAATVVGPVLDQLGRELAPDGRPLRIVLVPCGRLGIVPWHAARRADGGPRPYLCQRAVISYAASGSQLLRTLRRTPRPPAAAPVLLADPTQSLLYAEIEVLALRDSFYPTARLGGAFWELSPEELTPSTPEAVLDHLAEGVSVLHVATHGSAGTSPTASALHLLAPEHTPAQLTVTRLIESQQARHPGPDGPLVVLSACQTDLSTRDHDEALTLTTGFITAGARDVVGSRWSTTDGASALLMAVFHHHLNVDRLSPVDALRAAQLWMLDPQRQNPGCLRGELLRELDRPDLDRLPHWAAFIHQGHPGPA
ncbi:CHAT domain-containing protein [Kitasatospora sp. MMS16-BH015]|uniref:CHAT domain-containing protein n=1 Tax=Kitasatospora sp. MMS16-BH015 TaxID=2018025 RepID=UPI000CA1F1C3|nr:CHAT domain-containing protein [Kitasatospora sp. MMS16-BH015]AUG75841.1 CHAT domain-containing protein [Kitasatospora sp. MMS16-BH015]